MKIFRKITDTPQGKCVGVHLVSPWIPPLRDYLGRIKISRYYFDDVIHTDPFDGESAHEWLIAAVDEVLLRRGILGTSAEDHP